MAEKEERIYVSKHGENNPCDTCEDTSGEECDFCMENYEWNASIPRQEAIERMAKAICNLGDNETWERVDADYQNYCRSCAEYALNALLEADK